MTVWGATSAHYAVSLLLLPLPWLLLLLLMTPLMLLKTYLSAVSVEDCDVCDEVAFVPLCFIDEVRERQKHSWCFSSLLLLLLLLLPSGRWRL